MRDMARLTNKQSDSNQRRPSSREANLPAQSKDAVPPLHDIPKFDLAEQILAEQRKLSAVRRKGPTKRAKAPAPKKVHPVAHIVEPPPILSEQEHIIAEIVARDIENLVKVNALSLKG